MSKLFDVSVNFTFHFLLLFEDVFESLTWSDRYFWQNIKYWQIINYSSELLKWSLQFIELLTLEINFYMIEIQDSQIVIRFINKRNIKLNDTIIWYEISRNAFLKEIRFTSLITLQVAYVRSISFIYVVQKSWRGGFLSCVEIF